MASRFWRCVIVAAAICAVSLPRSATAKVEPKRSRTAQAYLNLMENFLGFAEQHWNDKENSYDAAGSGVTWPRGNGAVCLVASVLMTEYPERDTFSPRKIERKVLLDHVQRAIRKLCFTSNVCTDRRAIKPGTWGGQDPKEQTWHWQAGLETEHWVLAAHLLRDQLDADTLALVRQVAGAEADGAAARGIQSARPGDTAADDASWNAGILGVCAAIYADDPRAKKWDEWAKRWALNMEGRDPDRTSKRMIDGKPLGEWLVANNAYPDLTIVNHGFWDLPYQTSFGDLSEAIAAHKMCNLPVPEALHANAVEEGNEILKWLTMPDGDLLCPQGIDWAERDVQHSWAFTIIGTMMNEPWALAAEARCIDFLTNRQKMFGDGSIHALDFGYETDTARIWASSFMLHKYFEKPDSGKEFAAPQGSKLYPYVECAVFRAPDMASSVTWFGKRQAIMVSPTNLKAMADRPALTRWDHHSGTGTIAFAGRTAQIAPMSGKKKDQITYRIVGKPKINQDDGILKVSFTREVPKLAKQDIGYCALPNNAVVVFSSWKANADIEVAELADHPFRWVEIEKFISKPNVEESKPGVWNIDGKLQMEVIGGPGGDQARDGINGAVRRDFSAKSGDTMLETVCVYQPIVEGKPLVKVQGDAHSLQVGEWQLRRGEDGKLTATNNRAGK